MFFWTISLSSNFSIKNVSLMTQRLKDKGSQRAQTWSNPIEVRAQRTPKLLVFSYFVFFLSTKCAFICKPLSDWMGLSTFMRWFESALEAWMPLSQLLGLGHSCQPKFLSIRHNMLPPLCWNTCKNYFIKTQNHKNYLFSIWSSPSKNKAFCRVLGLNW